MNQYMRPYVLHLHRSIFLLVGPILATLGAVVAWNTADPQVTSAANITNVIVSTGAILAPVLAGFAAWDGLRERRHGGAAVLDVAVQPASKILLVQLAAGLTFTVLVFTVVVAAMHVRALMFTLVDPPLWANLGVSLLTLCLATTWGYLVAGLIKNWSAVIVAGLSPAVIYAYALLGPSTGLSASLAPFGNRGGGDFLDPNLPFFVGQLFFLGGLLLLMIGSIAVCSRRDRWWAATLIVCAIVVTGSGVWTVDSQHQRWGVPVEDPSSRLIRIASPSGDLTLAILPTYLPIKTDLLSRWERVQGILDDTPAAFTELEQLTDSHPEPVDHVGPLHAIYLNPSGQKIAIYSVLESLVDVHTLRCEDTRTFETALVEIWLAGDGAEKEAQLMPEHQKALAALRALSSEEASTWMSTNFSKFADCTIDLSDLPHL